MRNRSHRVELCRLLKAIVVLRLHARVFLYLLGLNALTQFIAPVRAQGLAVNTHDREAVRTFFNAGFYSGNGLAPNWTGDLSNCNPGTTSTQYQEAVLRRIEQKRITKSCTAPPNATPIKIQIALGR